MIAALVLVALTVAPNGPAEMRAPFDPLDACKRLAAAAAVDPAGATPDERAERRARTAVLGPLISYVEKSHKVMADGRWTSTDSSNYREVVRQLVTAGTDLAVLPEEALAWQRVGLHFSINQYRMIAVRVWCGCDTAEQLLVARAQFELFRLQYNQMLRQYTPTPK
jgi:hypothetical protein